MIRLFHVYYPARTLVLLACEAVILCGSFLLATVVRLGPDSYLVLNYENGWYKILAAAAIGMFCSYTLDLYAPQHLGSKGEVYFRLLLVLGSFSLILAAVVYFFPTFVLASNIFLLGLVILTAAMLAWRSMYNWVISRPSFSERVYILGDGESAKYLVGRIHERRDLGMEVVGWSGALGNGAMSREQMAEHLGALIPRRTVDRVIVAIANRRGVMPVRELLDLRLHGIQIEDSKSLLEKINGKIEIDDLYPSALIFSEGFRLNQAFVLARRLVSISISTVGLVLCLPLLPILALAVKFSSPGPILFRQERVGQRGQVFTVYKFRTMRQDAEAQTGAVWAGKNDPRVTRVGRIMRKSRLDEIPQLWNVLKGDMGFVGPRPERPEFVQWLAEKIPYYNLRHIIRPGLTGWAQVRYQYGATLEETKQKLEYDLYYIKHMSLGLDMLILLETVKTVLFRRGAQ